MKKKKLRLDELRVESFVTNNEEALGNTIKGGIDMPKYPIRNPIDTILCQPTPATWCYYCPINEL